MRQNQLRLTLGSPEIPRRNPPLTPPPKGSILLAVAKERSSIFWLLQSFAIGTEAQTLAMQEIAWDILQRWSSITDEQLPAEIGRLGIYTEHDQLDLQQTITMSEVRRALRRAAKKNLQ